MTRTDIDLLDRLRIAWTSCHDRVNDERAEAADEIERLRNERDEARRWVCIMKAQSVTYAYPPEHFAREHEWDCFKKDSDE